MPLYAGIPHTKENAMETEYTTRPLTYDDLSAAERDLLRSAYEAGFAAGSGRPWWLIADAHTTLIRAVEDDWFTALEVLQAVHRDGRFAAPADIPEWLRAQAERNGPCDES